MPYVFVLLQIGMVLSASFFVRGIVDWVSLCVLCGRKHWFCNVIFCGRIAILLHVGFVGPHTCTMFCANAIVPGQANKSPCSTAA